MEGQLPLFNVCKRCGNTRKVKGQYNQERPCPDCTAEGKKMGGFRKGAHDTEVKAAKTAYEAGPGDRSRLLDILYGRGDVGATDYEMSLQTRGLRGSVAKRRGELVERGLVEATEMRRLTDTGSTAIVWQITDRGREAIEENMKERADLA